MPTQAQLNANRLNAQKSTGPTTPEGTASSLNALKSGIDAWSHTIPGEDPAELEALTAAYQLHYQPADPTQLSLVDTLISAEWIQRRLRRIEAQLWNYQIECLDKNLSHADFLDASIQHNSPLGHSFYDALDPFTRIQRRIDGTNRMYLRTLKVLQDLQAAAASQPSEPASQPETPVYEPSSPVPTQPLTPPIGFVPTNGSASGEPPNLSQARPLAPPGANRKLISRRLGDSALKSPHRPGNGLEPLEQQQHALQKCAIIPLDRG
jgi:hypothetical protein